jgi:hypothetical protein
MKYLEIIKSHSLSYQIINSLGQKFIWYLVVNELLGVARVGRYQMQRFRGQTRKYEVVGRGLSAVG